ncbi:MAG: DUF3857 and transglutaminase domain-containing protein [Lysobacter sp.]|nr:DUF3857 and transglutaminase domain-containing protein [Lysobacter sp.]
MHAFQSTAAFLGLVLSALFPPMAAASPEDWPVRIERQHHAYAIEADGRYVETVETAIKVLKSSGLSFAKDSSIGYSTSIQQADVLEAYTLKPDGRRVPVPPGNFQVSSNQGRAGDSPIYSDRSRLTVVFPELAVGDTTVLRYRLTAKAPMFDGHFSVIDSFSPARYYGDVRVVIDAPASLRASHQAWHLKEVRNRVEGGRRVIEWAWQNRTPVDQDTLRDRTFDIERYPGYAFSSFPGYADIARAYGERADAKAEVTPRIAALASEISGDAGEPREIARRLYEWVSREISYAGNCIGLGAVVPRDLDVVLDNRMGDCKDHATLLQALLKARGIDSTQALVNAGNVHVLPKTPVASMVNHVITYVPALDLYMDSTSSTEPFGSLPASVAGKRVLLVHGYRDDTATPMPQRGNDSQRMRARLAIAEDGSVDGGVNIHINGRMAVAARESFREAGDRARKDMVRDYFRSGGMLADGSVRIEAPEAVPEQITLDVDYRVTDMVVLPGGFTVSPWFMNPMSISSIVSAQLPDPVRPAGETDCSGARSEESYEYTFAPSLRIVAVPPDVSLSEGPVTYTARHRIEDNRLIIDRTLDDRTPGPVCSAEYNTAYGRLMGLIMKNLRAQVVVLGPGAEVP